MPTKNKPRKPAKKPESDYVPNQVFLGLPWRPVRPKYEKIIKSLDKKYPISFVIIGRGRSDDQNADDLFIKIKTAISLSSSAIFDATKGNPNVSLELGYADGVGIRYAIYLCTHGAAQRRSESGPIIADLAGRTRIQYTNEKSLTQHLAKYCREHPYTLRFESALRSGFRNLKSGQKKRRRTLALKIVHLLDGKEYYRRADLVQLFTAGNYSKKEIDFVLKKLHISGVINCSVGRESRVTIF